jgi:glycosyltransferase involved in cell wall biosynthesis
MLENAACITAVSYYTAQATRNAFGPLPVEVIYNGIDLDGPFHPDTSHDVAKPFRLLFVGRWTRRKAVDLLAPIMKILGDGFVLSCTGDAPTRNVPANIRFLGSLPTDTDLAKAYRACDALLFPSRLEGFGLVALEAQACGKPVVAARNSAIPEVVEDGCTGLLVDTDDAEAFVAAIRQLAGDHARLARMGRAARASVENRFDLRQMLDGYIKVYRRALSST